MYEREKGERVKVRLSTAKQNYKISGGKRKLEAQLSKLWLTKSRQ